VRFDRYMVAATPIQSIIERTVNSPPLTRMTWRAGERSDRLMAVANKPEMNATSPSIDSCWPGRNAYSLGSGIVAVCATNPIRLRRATASKHAASVVFTARWRLLERRLA